MSSWRRRVYSKTYYQANKEKIAERNKIYGDKNREKLNEYAREYYKKNKEKLKEYGKKYANKNREKLNEYGRKYADKNREKINESAREYYKKNKEKIAEKGKRYRKKIQRSIWPEKIINEIINLYKTGKTLEEISFITGKKIQSLRGKLIEYKVYIRDPNTYSEEEWKKYRMAYAKKKPEVRALHGARARAKEKELPINIDIEYLRDIWPEDDKCPALDIEFRQGNNGISLDSSPSLDRIVPELGYIKGNVQWISKLANQIMSSATPDQVIQVGNYFKKIMEEKNAA